METNLLNIFHKDEKELIADKIHKLELLLNEKDQDLSYSLSVSSGYAYYQPDTDMDFKDIVRRSDTMFTSENEEKKYHIPLLLIRCFLPESNLVHKGSRMN